MITEKTESDFLEVHSQKTKSNGHTLQQVKNQTVHKRRTFSPQEWLRLAQGTQTGCGTAVLGRIQNAAEQGATYLV